MTRILTHSDFTDMPWKNGLGVTTEIYRIDVDGAMAFRVSSAIVPASGLFSDFSGYERTLVNLGSHPMFLTIGEHPESRLEAQGVIHFDGATKTHCRVESPTTDLNVFCAHNRYFASTIVRSLRKPEFIPIPAATGILIFVIKGTLVAHALDRREYHAHTSQVILREARDDLNADRWMLASASDEECVYAAVVFRRVDG